MPYQIVRSTTRVKRTSSRRSRSSAAYVLYGCVLIATTFVPRVVHSEDLIIDVTGLRSAEGRLMIAVYDRNGFLVPEKIAAGIKITLRHTLTPPERLTVTLDGIAPGHYAVSAYHDENGDDILNKNALGIPTEGRGFSRGARGRFGPPRFTDAAFRVGNEPARVSVPIEY